MIANRGLHILLQLGPVLRVHCMKESFEADRGRCWNTQHLWGIAAPLLLTGNKVPVPNCNVRGSKRDAVAVFGLLALLIESCQLGQRIPTRQERQRNNCAERVRSYTNSHIRTPIPPALILRRCTACR